MIDVVLVTYNRKEMVFEGLPLLLSSPLIGDVIVVDNASEDGLPREGPQRFPEVRWVLQEENRGCVAWNRGVEEATNPYVLILDDDCLPDFSALRAAVRRMEEDPELGLAAFNVLNHYSLLSEWGDMEFLDGSQGWANAIGACMLVRTEAFRQVGGYADFFLCFNDLELVLAMWEAGYQVVYDQRWFAYHKQKIQGKKKRRFYFETRNLLATCIEHLPRGKARAVGFFHLLRIARDLRRLEDIREMTRGVRDGLSRTGNVSRKGPEAIPPNVMRLFDRNFLLDKSEV